MLTYRRPKADRGALCSPKPERNIALLKDWLNGVTYVAMAKKYDISPARVQQIIAHAWQSPHLPHKLRARVKAERERRALSRWW